MSTQEIADCRLVMHRSSVGSFLGLRASIQNQMKMCPPALLRRNTMHGVTTHGDEALSALPRKEPETNGNLPDSAHIALT